VQVYRATKASGIPVNQPHTYTHSTHVIIIIIIIIIINILVHKLQLYNGDIDRSRGRSIEGVCQ
jgi:hypothetical protein